MVLLNIKTRNCTYLWLFVNKNTWGGFINLLSTRTCAILASYACRHLMVMSWLSLPLGSNRPSFCFEVALAVLWASTSSLAPLSPRVLGAWGFSPRVWRLVEQLSSCDVIRNAFANAYNRFPTDVANYGIVGWRDDERKIKDRHPQRSCDGDVD